MPGPRRAAYSCRSSVLLHGVEDAQDVDEEVDDVQVQVDGGQDVLLGGQPVHQQVGVIDDEAAEDQRPSTREQQLRHLIVEEQLEGHGEGQRSDSHLTTSLSQD